jgi:hypothetical protein
MKKIIFTIIITSFATFGFSQETKTELKTYDQKLVGCWKGSEIGQQIKGLRKYWVSCRMADGTSMLLFIAIDKNGEVTQETENGKWWTENGTYYELHNYDGVVDSYKYEVTEDGVNFRSIEMMGNVDGSYNFTDYKIEED